jgi:hypothetical protein
MSYLYLGKLIGQEKYKINLKPINGDVTGIKYDFVIYY